MGTRFNLMLAARRAAALRIRPLTEEENGHIIKFNVQDSHPYGWVFCPLAAEKCQLFRGFFALSRSTGRTGAPVQTKRTLTLFRLRGVSPVQFVPSGCKNADRDPVSGPGPGPV